MADGDGVLALSANFHVESDVVTEWKTRKVRSGSVVQWQCSAKHEGALIQLVRELIYGHSYY